MARPPVFIHRKDYLYVRLPKSELDGAKGHITIDPDIQFGEPCIKGTRIRTRIISQMIRGGDTMEYITKALEITKEDGEAAIEYIEGK